MVTKTWLSHALTPFYNHIIHGIDLSNPIIVADKKTPDLNILYKEGEEIEYNEEISK